MPKPAAIESTAVSRPLLSQERQAVIQAWNAMAEANGLARIRSMAGQRIVHLTARLTDVGLAGMLEAIAKIGASDYCRGAKGWRAGFDFLLQPSSLIKTLEGQYDNRPEPLRNGAREALLAMRDTPDVAAIEGPAHG